MALASSEALPLKIGGRALAAALAVSFVLQFQTSYFRIWRFDAETRILVEEINQRGVKAGRTMVAGISGLLQPGVLFYQTTLNLEAFEYAVFQEMRPDLDVYLLTSEDYGLIDKYGLRTVRAMSVAQILVAEPAVRNKP